LKPFSLERRRLELNAEYASVRPDIAVKRPEPASDAKLSMALPASFNTSSDAGDGD